MGLAVGERLGPYEIRSPIGAGGMGEVYRASDAKLGRDVALKLLPEAFAADPERLARFEREARVLASLNHPGIAHIYGFESAPLVDGTTAHFLAMELVEGEDLAERLKRGPLPIEDAVPVARQIAEALEEAHEKGIVHRDLKPGNVKLAPDGKVKVLDFGLAKAWSADDSAASGTGALSQSPTLAHTGTAAGLILGTAAYMSPEQARGKPVDRRSDIWSFGVVLHEMLTGRRLFDGETVTDVLAAVVRQEIDWSALPVGTPRAVRSLLGRCLERDSRRRLRDIGEARIALESPATAEAAARAPGVAGGWLPWLVAAAALVLAAVLGLRGRGTEGARPRPALLDAQLADDVQLGATIGHRIALSPDAAQIAFVGTAGSESALYVRALAGRVPIRIPDTAQAHQPFFSPDGRQVGYFAGGEIRRAAVGDGASNVVATVGSDARGATWGEDGTIVFTASQQGALERVPAGGGTPVPLTTLDTAKSERSHRWPSFLPGGRKLFFSAQTIRSTRNFDEAEIELIELASGKRTPLGVKGSAPRYADGQLLFVRRGRLYAAPFDARQDRLTGAAVVVAEDVMSDPRNGGAQYAASQRGVVAYVVGESTSREGQVVWSDRAGRLTPFLERKVRYMSPRFSPDGTRLAIEIGELGREDLYLAPSSGGTPTRLTFDAASDSAPVWSPDGARIIFSGETGRTFLVQNADGSGTPRKVYDVPAGQLAIPTAWSPDGSTVLFQQSGAASGFDILRLDLESGRAAALVATPANEIDACYSPDGRFVVYAEGPQGARQIYVRTLAEGGGRWQISTDGGIRPTWLATGEIVYQVPGTAVSRWISVPVRTSGGSFTAGAPRQLFAMRSDGEPLMRTWDLTPDGRRLAIIQTLSPVQPAPGVRVRLLFDWTRLLERDAAE